VSRRAGAAIAAVLVLAGSAASGRASSAPDATCRVVVDYAGSTVGEFPAGWDPRDDAARATYRVAVDDGLRFVRGVAEGTGSQMGREFEWDLARFPVLSWEWRPRVFPAGSDERQSDTNDSALAVYAVFGGNRLTGHAVKYVWSRTVPAGTTMPSGRARVVVLRSGAPADAGWVTEAVDVARDYRRLFGESADRPRGVAVLTDSDQTRSRAVGEYGPFRVCPARPG
jgi:hypothetical protein